MKKNYLALLLVAALIASLLGGCGKTEEVVAVETPEPEQATVIEEPEAPQVDTEEPKEADITGYYVYTFEEEMEGEMLEFTNTVELNADGTCEVTFQDTIPGTYTEDTILLDDGSKYAYTVSGDELILNLDGLELSFVKSNPDAAQMSTEATAAVDPEFVLSTVDIDGNVVTNDDIAGAKLVMVNFWEPWCGPCVHEMPDLERIYEEYQSEGFVILGVFSTTDMDDEAREVLTSCGTTYPILRYEDHMEPYITEYVPTTIFLDGNGTVLTDEPIIGGNDYNTWKQIVEEYMN